MSQKEFERQVEEAIRSIPEEFSRYLENVVFVLEEIPDEETMDSMGIEAPEDLLGLYDGAPLSERGLDSWGALPDRIFLYRAPIELYAEDFDEPVVKVIRDTILHEVGHFFGLTEEEVARMGLE